MADVMIQKYGPEGAERIGRGLRRNYTVGVVVAQWLAWETFFSVSHRSAFRGWPLVASFGVVLVVSVVSIRVARYGPTWLAFVAMGNVVLFVLSYFSLLFWSYGTAQNWSASLKHWDALYVALGTLTTAGTGNIDATSEFARRLLSMQMLVDLVVISLAVGVVVSRVTASRGS